jgi:tetratricopeptide (TPR) repeat protein
MSDGFTLRPISTASIPKALERVERYRLLNEPEQAESICLDVLEVEPENQDALVMLVLALTDQFGTGETASSAQRAIECVNRLADEYQRAYYTGIIRERRARAHLRRGMGRGSAFEAFREAMEWFEKAAAIRPEGNDDALLRWNACVRTIGRAHLEPPSAEAEQQLE